MYVVLSSCDPGSRSEPKTAKRLNPDDAAEGMASSAEMPAKSQKCRRYMRNVSSSRSPISSGRNRSGADTLTYLLLAPVSKPPAKRCTKEKGWELDQRATPDPDDVRVLFVEDDEL